jgi:hypothetical protein
VGDIAAGADTTPIRGVEFVPLAKSRAEAAIYLLIVTMRTASALACLLSRLGFWVLLPGQEPSPCRARGARGVRPADRAGPGLDVVAEPRQAVRRAGQLTAPATDRTGLLSHSLCYCYSDHYPNLGYRMGCHGGET